jgi:hypothetical protein
MKHDPGGKKKPNWPKGSEVKVHFSDCQRYRYCLSEIWNSELPLVMYLMMNPSVAGLEYADPTLIKTGKYARAWGYGGQLVGNVHAYRVTESRHLTKAEDPVGPLNDAAILRMAENAEIIVLAYGLPPKPLQLRAISVVNFLVGNFTLKCLKTTKNGTPHHPLYLKSDLRPTDFRVQLTNTDIEA